LEHMSACSETVQETQGSFFLFCIKLLALT
jgi:hypothetical protein